MKGYCLICKADRIKTSLNDVNIDKIIREIFPEFALQEIILKNSLILLNKRLNIEKEDNPCGLIKVTKIRSINLESGRLDVYLK